MSTYSSGLEALAKGAILSPFTRARLGSPNHRPTSAVPAAPSS